MWKPAAKQCPTIRSTSCAGTLPTPGTVFPIPAARSTPVNAAKTSLDVTGPSFSTLVTKPRMARIAASVTSSTDSSKSGPGNSLISPSRPLANTSAFHLPEVSSQPRERRRLPRSVQAAAAPGPFQRGGPSAGGLPCSSSAGPANLCWDRRGSTPPLTAGAGPAGHLTDVAIAALAQEPIDQVRAWLDPIVPPGRRLPPAGCCATSRAGVDSRDVRSGERGDGLRFVLELARRQRGSTGNRSWARSCAGRVCPIRCTDAPSLRPHPERTC